MKFDWKRLAFIPEPPPLSPTTQLILAHYDCCDVLPLPGSLRQSAIDRWVEVTTAHEKAVLGTAFKAAIVRIRAAQVVIALGGEEEPAPSKASPQPPPPQTAIQQLAAAAAQGLKLNPSQLQRMMLQHGINPLAQAQAESIQAQYNSNMAAQFGLAHVDQRSLGASFNGDN